MTTTRRGFLGAMLAACAAPAIVKASSLMPIYVPKIIAPPYLTLWGDGVHDDTLALQAMIDGKEVVRHDGASFSRNPDGAIFLASGTYAVSSAIRLTGDGHHHIENCNFIGLGNPESLFKWEPPVAPFRKTQGGYYWGNT